MLVCISSHTKNHFMAVVNMRSMFRCLAKVFLLRAIAVGDGLTQRCTNRSPVIGRRGTERRLSMQIFHRSTNTLSRATIYGAIFVVAALFWAAAEIQRSSYVTYAGVRRPQPVPFSHQHHVAGLGIDCRYCHTSVETSSFAGIPPTKTCMNCHAQIWTNAALLEPVTRELQDRQSRWSGPGSMICPTSPISITAFISIRA